MYLNEEDAFWALVILIGSPKFAMHGMLIPGLPKLLAYCEYHATMRKRFLSRLDRHLVSGRINYFKQGFTLRGAGGGIGGNPPLTRIPDLMLYL